MGQKNFPIGEGMSEVKKTKIEIEIPENHAEFLTNFARVKKQSIEQFIEELVMDEIDDILEGSGLDQLSGTLIAPLYGIDAKQTPEA